jgi:hypothetical protein
MKDSDAGGICVVPGVNIFIQTLLDCEADFSTVYISEGGSKDEQIIVLILQDRYVRRNKGLSKTKREKEYAVPYYFTCSHWSREHEGPNQIICIIYSHFDLQVMSPKQFLTPESAATGATPRRP